MNRRTLITGAAAALVVPVLPRSLSAQQATPQATPSAVADVFLAPEGQLAQAGREFEASGLRLGAQSIVTMLTIYDNDDHAKAAFKKPMFFEELKKTLARQNGTIGEPKEASAPKLGDERVAEAATGNWTGRAVYVAVFRARKVSAVHLWFAFGLSDPLVELLELAEKTMRFDVVDPKNDEALLALLPKLDEMPPGFTVDDEGVVRP